MSSKVDIFELLQHIDDFDVNYIESLTPEEKKTIAPYLVMMWMGGCNSPLQVRLVNSLLNSTVFEIPSSHSDLLLKLALIASDGKRKRYKWIKRKNTNKKYSTAVSVLRRHYHCSTETALSYIPLLSYNDVAEIAMELGEQDDVLKKIKKEMK